MFENPSLITRIAIGKGIGLMFGLLGFFSMAAFWPESDSLLRWGVLLWYITVGAVIGVFGAVSWHPVLKLPLPWWIRAPIIGGWMNFVLTFFAYDTFQAMILAVFGPNSFFSPFWSILEGAVIGLVIGFFATRFGGEGKETIVGQP